MTERDYFLTTLSGAPPALLQAAGSVLQNSSLVAQIERTSPQCALLSAFTLIAVYRDAITELQARVKALEGSVKV